MEIKTEIQTKFTLKFEIPLLGVKIEVESDDYQKVKSMLNTFDMPLVGLGSSYRGLKQRANKDNVLKVWEEFTIQNKMMICEVYMSISNPKNYD
jgi:hypothetical protein